jgi:hypothetical protein
MAIFPDQLTVGRGLRSKSDSSVLSMSASSSAKAPIMAMALSNETHGDSITLSDNSPGSGGSARASHRPEAGGLSADFVNLIPDKPYCTDDLGYGVVIRPKLVAIRKRHIQLNGPSNLRWLQHDIDRRGAYYAHEDANLPAPNFIAINPDNGHAHSAYLLATPVHCHSVARLAPLRLFNAVRLGTTRRLDADLHYAGNTIKNPLNPHWGVEWRRHQPYTLQELLDWLFFEDMAPEPIAETTGEGRNVIVFDKLRNIAYREVIHFKREGRSFDGFQRRCEDLANGINQQFVGYQVKRSDGRINRGPLKASDISAISKSGARWTWRRFSPSTFSAIQSLRGRRGMANRWAEHESARTAKPWEALGISERTYYRRKRAAKCERPTRQQSTGAKPWESMGISRATYYRGKKAGKL